MRLCSPDDFSGPEPDLHWYGWADTTLNFTGYSGVTELTDLQRTLFLNFLNTTVQVVMPLPDNVGQALTYTEDTNRAHSLPEEPAIAVVSRGGIPIELNAHFGSSPVGVSHHAIDYQVQAIVRRSGDMDNANSMGSPVLCQLPNATLHYTLHVLPPEHNYLGNLVIVGWTALAITWLLCAICGACMYRYRHIRSIQVMQPVFLTVILFGVAVLGAAQATLSISDEHASTTVANHACVAAPWFFVTGFTLIFAALFAKLWRINQVFMAARKCQRVNVSKARVVWPLVTWLVLNWIVLAIRTALVPMQFERVEIDDNPANTIGVCRNDTVTDLVLYVANIVITLSAFGAAAYQAYRARHISDEYAESRSLLTAIFIWTEILIIGVPVVLLVGFDSPQTSYFVLVAMTFGLCLAMLGAIFGPLYWQVVRQQQQPKNGEHRHRSVHISGTMTLTPPPHQFQESIKHSLAAAVGATNRQRWSMTTTTGQGRNVRVVDDHQDLDQTSQTSCEHHAALLVQQVAHLEAQVETLQQQNRALEARLLVQQQEDKEHADQISDQVQEETSPV